MDKEWNARLQSLFGETGIRKQDSESVDNFVGRLRELEDGEESLKNFRERNRSILDHL